ncbi:uncharacterized protein LOC126842182 [Adelges cooleyi]|uniref:uncharacterized protein LOC126842182 n=1 Tax=Adelges cooleyi TaxID=133065 RepID=UPI00218021A5|nr:uncharacterized protein LOC126842182 [Adelges cooleyi]
MCTGQKKKVVLGNGKNACVSCVIELLTITKGKDPSRSTDNDKIVEAERHKKIGNDLFKQKRPVDAFHRFNKAIRLVIFLHDPQALLKDWNLLYTSLCNNMAACQLEFNNYEYAKQLLDKVLATDKENIKALMRRCRASAELKMYDRTLADAKSVLAVEPNNAVGKKYEEIAVEALRLQNVNYKNMVKKMFI